MTGFNIKDEVDGWVYEESPCEDCPNWAACKAQLACAAFECFVATGGRRWAAEAREPSREAYERVFRGAVL
jgi:hypothetical protein